MKIAVVCANGRVGQLVAKELVERGEDVTAIARGENRSAAREFMSKDLFDLTKDDLAGFDVVIDAFGAWTPDTIPGIPAAMKHLADVLEGTDARLLVVGGAGSLYTDPERTVTLDQGADFPEDWKPLSSAHAEGLHDLEGRRDLKWTYVSPAADFQADGARTGAYKLAGEELTLSDNGKSEISYADYAIALADEAEHGDHIQQHISVVRR